MATMLDCAILSEDVYNRENNSLAEGQGWNRLDAQNWQEGFAAGCYRKGEEVVIAFRGTDDMSDAVSDARMVPLLREGAANDTLTALLMQYGVADTSPVARTIQRLLIVALESQYSSNAIRDHANQVPPNQARQALAYYDEKSQGNTTVVGHSLGGALAKYVSFERSTQAIGFNSPFMGDIQGTVPQTSMLIQSVNTIGDPLSLATRAAGNLSHGADIAVRIPPMNRRPPNFQPARRRQECGWRQVITAGPTGYVMCRGASEARYRMRQAGAEVEYLRALVEYLGEAMLYHHSMTNLRTAITTQGLTF